MMQHCYPGWGLLFVWGGPLRGKHGPQEVLCVQILHATGVTLLPGHMELVKEAGGSLASMGGGGEGSGGGLCWVWSARSPYTAFYCNMTEPGH